jgi:competence protein ComEA
MNLLPLLFTKQLKYVFCISVNELIHHSPWRNKMTTLLKSLFLALGLAGLMSGLVYAKEESKQMPGKADSKSTAAKDDSKQSAGASSEKSGTSGASASPGSSASSGSSGSASGSASAVGSKAEAQVDINSASEKELAALPKIGDAKAKAIVKNRPYRGKDDLVDKKILTKTEYDAIKDQLVAKQNTASSGKSSGSSSGSSGMSSDSSAGKSADKAPAKSSDMSSEKRSKTSSY